MSNIGFATLSIVPSMRGAQSALSSQATSAGAGAGTKAGGAFSGALSTALKVGGAAAIGTAIKGVLDFTSFERQMNEVFTLLPGISGEAMSKMEGQVKDFSREFGVLPNEIIPSLYDSLSAGVPPDNVFAFLEQSQKLARGGAAEVGVAVDALTSVVNAYGAENISAAEASDLIFTTVKAGKTTVDELGASLFQVTPIAASLGVGFDQVSAAMAGLTSVTGNTSVASTQLKAALSELGKDGSTAFTAFEEATGKTFPAFIAEGGNLGEGLSAMSALAEENGTSLGNLFGSVEAGQAALTLAADGASVFNSNLEGMQDSAGATEAAFDQMNQGLGPIFDKIKAGLAVFFIDVGQRLAPLVESALSAAGGAFDDLRPTFDRFVSGAQVVVEVFSETVVPALADFAAWVKDNKPILIGALSGLAAVAAAVLVPAFIAWAAAAGAAAVATLVAIAPFVAIGAAVAAVAAGLVWAYQNWDFFRNAVDAVASFVVGTLWPALQSLASFFTGAFIPALAEVVSWIGDRFAQVFDLLAGPIGLAWEYISTTVSNAIEFVQGVIDVAMGVITGDWGRAWEGIQTALGAAWSQIKNIASTAIDAVVSYLRNFPGRALSAVGNLLTTLPGKGRDLIRGLFDGIANYWSNVLWPWIRNIPTMVKNGIPNALGILWGIGRDMIQGLINGAQSLATTAKNAIVGIVTAPYNAAKSFLGIDSPSKLFAEMGVNVGEGFILGMDSMAPGVARSGEGLANAAIPNVNMAPLGGVAGFDSSGGRRGDLTFNVTVEDKHLVPELDFYARSTMAGV